MADLHLPISLDEIREILREGLRGTDAKVFLFGSRANGTAHAASDVDVGILPLTPLPVGLLSSIREALEESTIPWSVDLIDLSQTDAAFESRVRREGILWSD